MIAAITDRDLLELAAKAAGVSIVWGELAECFFVGGECLQPWTPLHDDGDALRLALKLSLAIIFDHYPMRSNDLFGRSFRVRIWCTSGWVKEEFNSEEAKAAAVRLCIVRAAAEIGKAMR